IILASKEFTEESHKRLVYIYERPRPKIDTADLRHRPTDRSSIPGANNQRLRCARALAGLVVITCAAELRVPPACNVQTRDLPCRYQFGDTQRSPEWVFRIEMFKPGLPLNIGASQRLVH